MLDWYFYKYQTVILILIDSSLLNIDITKHKRFSWDQFVLPKIIIHLVNTVFSPKITTYLFLFTSHLLLLLQKEDKQTVAYHSGDSGEDANPFLRYCFFQPFVHQQWRVPSSRRTCQGRGHGLGQSCIRRWHVVLRRGPVNRPWIQRSGHKATDP